MTASRQWTLDFSTVAASAASTPGAPRRRTGGSPLLYRPFRFAGPLETLAPAEEPAVIQEREGVPYIRKDLCDSPPGELNRDFKALVDSLLAQPGETARA